MHSLLKQYFFCINHLLEGGLAITWTISLILLATTVLEAQVDTSITLSTVEIQASPLRTQPIGGRIEKWDMATLQNNATGSIADILEKESGIFVKSYGLGSIATTAIRGASAGHTAIVWNGLALQSPMLGLLDLSMLPTGFVEEAQIEYGGNAALWGNGAIGGVIALNNTHIFREQKKISLGMTIGSFGYNQQQLKFSLGGNKWRSRTRLFNQQASNDFTYQIRKDLPVKQQTNAAVTQQGILQEWAIKIKERQQLNIHIWGQQANRQIPPTSTQTRSVARQLDDFIRTAVHWKYKGQQQELQARVGYFEEHIDFQDEAILLHALTGFQTVIGELEGLLKVSNKQQFQWGVNHTYTTANAANYAQSPHQQRTALFAAFRQNWGHWKAQLNWRQELVDGRLAPFVPSLGVEGLVNNNLVVKAKISRNYRLPTLNDRYWQPGGNEDLLAERGWSQELTLQTFGRLSKQEWRYSITGFNRQIDNWILWSIQEGDAYWSANNIAKVWSRGVEQRITWNYNHNDWSATGRLGYDYIRSTNQIALSHPAIEKGTQLIYVPSHQAFTKLALGWKQWQLTYQQTFTGATNGISDRLPSYWVAYGRCQYNGQYKHFNHQIFLQINNFWNTTYRVIERRPMPGRYFQIGINLSYSR